MCVLTISHVGWREVVVNKKGCVFGHTEVNNIRSGLQGSHCLLVSYLLQTGGVHLETHGDIYTLLPCTGMNKHTSNVERTSCCQAPDCSKNRVDSIMMFYGCVHGLNIDLCLFSTSLIYRHLSHSHSDGRGCYARCQLLIASKQQY